MLEDHGSCVCNLGNCKISLKKYRLGWDIHKPNDSSAALLPTELSSQLGVVGLCVNSYIFPRKTNQNHVLVFFSILRVHVTNIVISIFVKKRKSGFSTILVIF